MELHNSDDLVINETTLPILVQLSEQLPGGFFIYHADGKQELIYFNSYMPAIFGCKDNEEFIEHVNNSFLGMVHPDDYSRIENDITAQKENSDRKIGHIKYRFIKKNGSIGVMDDYGHFNHSESFGDIFYVFVQDITEQSVNDEQRKYGQLLPEQVRNDILNDIIHSGRWAFYVNSDDEIVESDVSVEANTIIRNDVKADGHSWLDIVHPDDKEDAANAFYATIKDHTCNTPYDVNYRMMDRNGEYRWFHSAGRIVRNEEGNGEFFGIHVDITDQMEVQQIRLQQLELEASTVRAEMLTFISDHEPDADLFIDFFSKRLLEVINCDQVIFRHPNGKRVIVTGEGVKGALQKTCSKCAFADFDREDFGDKGIVLMNDCSKGFHGMRPTMDCPSQSSYMQKIYSDDQLEGLLSVHYIGKKHKFSDREIEKIKTAGIHLGQLLMRIAAIKSNMEKLKAESASEAKTQFLFNMSHDIRTPMNAILGYTDIGLKNVKDIDKTRDCYEKIRLAGGHLLNLINDILEMSRIESGKLELAENPMDIRKCIEGISQIGNSLAIAQNIDYETKLGNAINPYVYSDELHINEVLINLVSNAIKYTPSGGRVRFNIDQISTVIDGKVTYRFEVSDNGIGMSEEFQQHLFEAFSREQTSTVSKLEGAGLGLSIVKKIVDMAGGTISVVSRPKRGSSFTVEIPFKVMGDDKIDTFIRSSNSVFESKEDFVLEGKRVLLVEDNEMNREIASDILIEAGMFLDTAEDGKVALKMVTEKGPEYYDFILMDIQMPVMDGYAATKAIRSLPKGDVVPIIALSANAFEEDKQKSIENGMNSHVAKPIDVKVLLDTLRDLM